MDITPKTGQTVPTPCQVKGVSSSQKALRGTGSDRPHCHLSGGAKLQRLWGRENRFIPGKCKAVCVYQRGVMLYPHPGALGNLSSSGQGASGHFSTFTCLTKHLLQLWQVSTPQTWTGLMPSQTRSHHSVFAGRCSYNILKTAPAFQPGVSEGKTSACETASSGIPGPAVRAGI